MSLLPFFYNLFATEPFNDTAFSVTYFNQALGREMAYRYIEINVKLDRKWVRPLSVVCIIFTGKRAPALPAWVSNCAHRCK